MSDPENSGASRKALTQFKPGQSGNPKGKPKGSRNKLGQAFTEDLYADWVEAENGRAVIARVRQEEPAQYLRVIAGLLPKEVKIERTDDMTDDQLRHRIKQLAADLGTAVGIIEGTLSPPGGTEAPPRPH